MNEFSTWQWVKSGLIILVVALGLMFGEYYLIEKTWKDDAITQGFAGYDKHLNFKWKERDEIIGEFLIENQLKALGQLSLEPEEETKSPPKQSFRLGE